MVATIYLRGKKSSDGQFLISSLPTNGILFVLQYCESQHFDLVFIVPMSQVLGGDVESVCKLPISALDGFSVTFMTWEEAPLLVQNVSLPSIHQDWLVRAGLCVVVRHIIKTAHKHAPNKNIIHLLGFRQGSLRMCAEVSGWTKLCEVELPSSISDILQSLSVLKAQSTESNEQMDGSSHCLTLPLDLLKLEGNFSKPCRIHNDDKKKRAELVQLQKMLGPGVTDDIATDIQNLKLSSDASHAQIERLSLQGHKLDIEVMIPLLHGVRRFCVNKTISHTKTKKNTKKVDSNGISSSEKTVGGEEHTNEGHEMLKPQMTIQDAMKQVTYQDIDFVHTYSEGPEMTVADLILFVYIFHFLDHLNFDTELVSHCLSSIMKWMEHMAMLPKVSKAAVSLGWNISLLHPMSDNRCSRQEKSTRITFQLPEQPYLEEEDEMELSRCARMKHKAIKPEVFQVFKKLEMAKLEAKPGQHPCGTNVTVDWNSLPPWVHPSQGDVPLKRAVRKCQQLENLVTAALTQAKPGSVLVDFCSGGGHLGIVLAYLLPDCQVYLVENKEESLLKVCSRLESLALKNVTLYQCNMDYFIGNFNVGMCLHACGSATDAVLKLCLRAGASFVVCPCCYGSIHTTHLLNYPRSQSFQGAGITYKDFLTLGHAADQTEFNIALEGQGRRCMDLVDTDRAAHAQEYGYSVTLCSLQPLTCSPKNNLLIGSPADLALAR